MSIARGFVPFVHVTLVDAALDFTLLSLRSIAVFGGAISNLMTNAIALSFIHGVLMSLLCSARKTAREFRIDVAHRVSNTLERTEAEPLVDTVAVFNRFTENMFATGLEEFDPMIASPFTN